MIQLLNAITLSIWRRWFGGANIGGDKYEDAFFNQRWFRYIIGLLVTGLFLWYKKCNYFQIIGADCVLYFAMWGIGHGCAFDISRDGYPDEDMIKRYKKYFWNKWCEFLVPKNSWYGFGYDFIWMMFRYTLPAIIISIILLNPLFILSGVLVALSYAVCWSLYDKDKIKAPTELAELIAGFITGILL